jgi:hypothetical protein
METYTIAAAARLVGMAKGKLYQAIRTGRLQATTGPEPGDVLMVTTAALQEAGFSVPSTTLTPAPAAATSAMAAASAVDVPAPSQELPPVSSGAEQALIAHLERALEAAQARENRLLDLLAQFTQPQSTPSAPLMPERQSTAPAASAGSRAAIPPPQGSLRQQILSVLQAHPEGMSPQAVRTLLHLDREVRSTMKGMVRSGLLTRLEAGRYVVATTGSEA